MTASVAEVQQWTTYKQKQYRLTVVLLFLLPKCCIALSTKLCYTTLEQNIETPLYKDFDEKGVEISGGEMQKLCLARAIYKGSPFIILDEPTAALDPPLRTRYLYQIQRHRWHKNCHLHFKPPVKLSLLR